MASGVRRAWLDWQRGLAVLFMIEVHVVGGWILPSDATGTLHRLLRFLGGLAAPGFLYMAGLALVLADDALQRRGVGPAARRRTHLERALWLLGVAYSFRLVQYVLGGRFLNAYGVLEIARVDVLNIIAVALAVVSLTLTSGVRAERLLALVLTVVVGVTPALEALGPGAWLGGYLYNPPQVGFGACNWIAFAAAGALVGKLLLRGGRPAHLFALGAAVMALGFALEPLGHGAFWVTSPAWFFIRLAITILTSAVLASLPERLPALAPLTRLGRHSLFGYMFSVELTYGFWFKFWHAALPLPAVLAGVVGMSAVTYGAMVLLERWQALRERRAQGLATA